MSSDQEFAKGIYTIIAAFIDSPTTVKDLESYYLSNKKSIATMRSNSEEQYQQLIKDFKEVKHAINTDPVRQEPADKTAGGEGQVTPEQEDKLRREERTRQHRKSYPSAGFWKG